jgi:hypothetical protein
MNNNTYKLFNSLKIPKNVFNPVKSIPAPGDWNVILSPRGVGKTTNLLLLGMCDNWINGTEIQYIRQYDDMLIPSRINDLFDVILQNNYVNKITDGKWNNVRYYRRRWYYCNLDETGTEIDRCNTPFMVCLGINREHDLRSSYNAPKGDFIIVDEFMRADKMYIRDEFVILNNLLSTIIRNRTTAHIYLLANLVDITCPYLSEMGIHDIVKSMSFGDFRQLTSGNTVLDILLISPPDDGGKSNKYFSPWTNNKMTGITGANGVWAIKMYPHAPHDEFTIIDRAQLECKDGYICRELRLYRNGYYIMFYPISEPDTSKVTYTRDDSKPFSTLRRFGLGYSDTDKIIIKLVNLRRWYFSDNTTGERVEVFVKGL